MAATLSLCASRKMLSSVSLLPMPLAFHCNMLNVLSDMVGVRAGLEIRVKWTIHKMNCKFEQCDNYVIIQELT